MAKINDGTFRNWNNGEVMNEADYEQEREIIRTAINDNYDRLIKKFEVLDSAGTLKTTQNLDLAINYLKFKESDTVLLTLNNTTGTLTLAVKDASMTTAKLVDGSITTVKLSDGSITTSKIVDGSVTLAKVDTASLGTHFTEQEGDHPGTWQGYNSPIEASEGILLDEIEKAKRAPIEYEWTATEGQTSFVLPNGNTFPVGENAIELVTVGTVPQTTSVTEKVNGTGFDLVEGVAAGTKVFIRYYDFHVPWTAGHSSSHYVGGTDALDITQLVNYDTEVSDKISILTNYFHAESYRTGLDLDDGSCIIQAMTEANNAGGGTVLLANKTYNVSFTNQTFPSNVKLQAGGKKSKINFTVTGILFKSSGKQNIEIEGIQLQGIDNNSVVLEVDTVDGVRISKCRAVNLRLFRSALPLGTTYGTVNDGLLNKNIEIVDNIANGLDKTLSAACILLEYVKGVKIRGNTISNYDQGVQWWGGDSNTNVNGDLANPRWAIDISISDNRVFNIQNGGIWGSMGANVSICNGNKVSDCGDVGIDVEGCFFVSVTGNQVKNCANGCIATFYRNKGVVISGNSVETSVDGQYAFRIYNASLGDNHSIEVANNEFVHTGTGIGYVGGDQVDSLLISNNQMVNTAIKLTSINYREVKINDNQIIFTNSYPTAFAAIQTGMVIGDGKVSIKDNIIVSRVEQNTGSAGVYVVLSDYNSMTRAVIEGNEIEGFAIDIETFANSANAGIVPRFIVKNNMMASRNYKRSEGTTLKSKVILEGNFDKDLTPYPSVIPTSSKWDIGQRIYYPSPTTGGATGAICVSSGTPGTWEEINPSLGTTTNATLLNGFTNYGSGYSTVGYYKDRLGIIRLEGTVQAGSTVTVGTILFTLPTGYRPLTHRVFVGTSDQGLVKIDINTNGNVSLASATVTATTGNLTLDGISFRTT